MASSSFNIVPIATYTATLSGTVGTSNTLLSGSLTLPKGTYIVSASLGSGTKIKGCNIANSSTVSGTAILLGNQNGNSVMGYITLSSETTLYCYGAATESTTITSDNRFTYIKAVRVA